MAKLTYEACKCIRRGDCILPGTVGKLFVHTQGKTYYVSPCPRCKEGN